MHRTYDTETHDRQVRNISLTVENLIPVYRNREERNSAREQIERQLYEIFCKYVSTTA